MQNVYRHCLLWMLTGLISVHPSWAAQEQALASSALGSPFGKNAQVVAITVTGRITDEKDQPLPGVTILEKGTNNGTTTNAEGRYSMTVAGETSVLVFSYIGYTTEEMPVQGRTQIDLSLLPDITTLSDIVVIGYGTVRKSDLTGSVSSLNTKEFNPGMQASVDQMIQGRAAGVQITQTSSEPGGGVSVRIRGTASLTAGNEPLYVIDGLPIDNSQATPGSSVNVDRSPRNPLNSLNPGDIESIEILKDASSTAIYGSRGANGVILITTKQGKAGRLAVNYEVNAGVQTVAKQIDMLNATEYMTFLNDINTDQGLAPEFSAETIAAVGAGTDWQAEVFRDAPTQNHQLSFSGGSEKTTYYASLNYFNQQGVVLNTGVKRYAARLNLRHTIDRFNFGVNLNTSFIRDNFVPSGVSINQNAGVIATALQMVPTLPVRNPDGTFAQTDLVDLDNPVGLAEGVFDEAETNRTFGNIFAEYTLLPGLKAKLDLGTDRQTSRRDTYVTRETKRGQRAGGEGYVASNERSNYQAELTLSYNKQWGENHRVNAVAGVVYQEFIRRGLSASGLGYTTDAFLTNSLDAGTQRTFLMGSSKVKNQLLSYLGRVNYTLFNKYLLTGTFRADGSSRFGANTKYSYFPSVALGWRLADEPFISGLDLFSDLKLRASYGITGNQEIGSYNSLNLAGTVGQAVLGGTQVVGIAPIQIANPDLKWETTAQLNIGLDYGFFNGRLNGSLDYFLKNTDDLLLNLPIPTTTGFATSLQNVGSTRNSGVELLVNSVNLDGKFGWNTSLNFSAIRNKVTDLGGLPYILQGSGRFVNEVSILRVGDPINAYYGYQVAGIYQQGDDIAASPQPLARPGELRYADIDPDNAITTADRTILGSPFPDFTAGLNNTFTYAGFDLSIFLEAVQGMELFNFNRIDSENPISFVRNRQTYVLNRWTPDNPTNENPSFIEPRVAYGSLVNSRAVEDASFLRVKNIRLGYNFPGVKFKWMKSLSAYATAQNVFTFTKYSGYNPDVNSFGDSSIRVDYNAYPLARIFLLGLTIGL